MPDMTKAAPARAASETRSRGNGSPIEHSRKECAVQNQTTEGRKSPILDGIDVGVRVMSTEGASAGYCGTVRSVERIPARYDGVDAPIVPARIIVTVDMDNGQGVAYISDGGEPLRLVPTAAPIDCVSWCRDHDGHPNERFAEDQVCESKAAVVRPSAEATGGGRFFQTFSIVARQSTGVEPAGVILWEIERDWEQLMTPHEARAMATALLTAASQIEELAQ